MALGACRILLALLIALMILEVAAFYAWNRFHDRAASTLTAPVDQIVTGLIGAVAVVSIGLLLLGSPWDELRLIQSGETTGGYMVDFREDVVERNGGRTVDVVYRVTYQYSVEGQKYEGTFTRPGPAEAAEIEYVPGDPGVSRIKGVGHSSFTGWLIANVLAGVIVAALVAACLGITVRGFKQLVAMRHLPEQPPLL